MQAIPYLCDRLHGEADRLRTLYHIIYSGAAAGRTFPKLFPIADKNLHPLPRVGDRLRTLYHIIYSGAAAGRTFPKLFPIADKNLHPLPRVGIRGCIPHKR